MPPRPLQISPAPLPDEMTGTERFEPEDVERVIRRAMHIENDRSISRDDLIDAACEVGIDRAAIERAIDEEAQAIEHARGARARRLRQQRRWQRQLTGAAILVVALALIDAMTPGPWWFQWPLLGLAIAFALRARNRYFPTTRG